MLHRSKLISHLAAIFVCVVGAASCKGDDASGPDAASNKADAGVFKTCSVTPCTKDSDCTKKLPVCDESGGSCVECQKDADCAHFTDRPYCQERTQTCISCRTDADCKTNLKECNKFMGVCKQCEKDSDCSSMNARCERASNVCMRCDEDTDCRGLVLPPGFPTDKEWTRCVRVHSMINVKVCMQCSKNADCANQPFKRCKLDPWGAMACIGCTSDAECCEAGGDCGLKCDIYSGKCRCQTDAQCQSANKNKGGVWKCRAKD